VDHVPVAGLGAQFGLQRDGRVDVFVLGRLLGCHVFIGRRGSLVGRRFIDNRLGWIVSGDLCQGSFDVDRRTHRQIAVGGSHGLWILPNK
jgi:hypothetical protein